MSDPPSPSAAARSSTDAGVPPAAIACPGVGIAPSGKEAGFFATHRQRMKPLLDEASELAGVDLVAAVTANSWTELAAPASELFTYAFNCGVAEAYRHCGVVPVAVAGHSLGIYSALVQAGAVSYRDGLRMTDRAHRLAAEAVDTASGKGIRFAMGVVLGLERAELEQLVAPLPERDVCLVNSNSATSHVLSGTRPGVEQVLAGATALEALRTALLDVALPYHNPAWLAGASIDFAAFLKELAWSDAQCPVVSSIDQELLVQPARLLDLTARNLSTPIRWDGVVTALGAAGVALVFEAGPGLSLCQNARFIPGAPRHVHLGTAHRRLPVAAG